MAYAEIIKTRDGYRWIAHWDTGGTEIAQENFETAPEAGKAAEPLPLTILNPLEE